MPANVSENMRPTVTDGFAKDVLDVNQYAAPMYAPTAGAAHAPRPVRARAKMSATSPAVATTSPTHRCQSDAVMRGELRRHVEHDVRQHRAGDTAQGLRHRVGPDIATREPSACTPAQPPVRGRHDRVEVRPRRWSEQQDEHGQPEHGRGRVVEQLQPDVVGGQVGRGDARADDHRDQQRGPDRLGEQTTCERRTAGRHQQGLFSAARAAVASAANRAPSPSRTSGRSR